MVSAVLAGNPKNLMTDETENLVLAQLRAIRTDIANVRGDTQEIKTRLSSLEQHVVQLHRNITVLRIERIERRLDLQEAP